MDLNPIQYLFELTDQSIDLLIIPGNKASEVI